MTILPITSLTAALLAVLFIILALHVITLRRKGIGPSVGYNDSERFMRAVRAHGNLGEYAPFFLILLGLYEFQDGHRLLLIASAVTFVVGRLLHAIGFGYLQTGPWRTIGMVATNTAILALAAGNVLLALTVTF